MATTQEKVLDPARSATTHRIEVTPRTMVVAALVVGGAWVALRLVPVLLVVVVALFLVGTFTPIVAWLERRGVKRHLGVAAIFGALLLGLLGVLALTVPAVIDQIAAIVGDEAALRARAADWLARSHLTSPLADALRTLDYRALARGSAATALDYSRRSIEIVAYLGSAVFLALYVMIDRDRLRGALYAVVPRTGHMRLSRVLVNLEVIVGGYIRGQVLTSVMMGAFTFALLTACGVKNAAAIAVVAGLADVLPYVGVLVSVGLAVAAAAARGPVVVGVVLFAMLAYAEFESRVLVPRIYGTVLKLPSSIVLVALLAGGTLMGIPGALLALPVAAAIRMLVEELRVELPGEDIDDSKIRAEDARADREYELRAEGVPADEAAAIALAIAEHAPYVEIEVEEA